MPASVSRPFSRCIPHLALLTAMCVWSTSYVALRITLSGLTPIQAMSGRMLVASLVFLPLWPRLFRDLRRQGHLGALLLMGFCEPCCYFLFETHALRLTTASQAGMVVSLLPLIVAGVAWVVLDERISGRVWLGFALAVGGVVWLSLAATPADNAVNPLLGNTLEALAMLCAAFYTVIARRLSPLYNPMQITAAQSGLGMLFFLPATALSAGDDPPHIPGSGIARLGSLGQRALPRRLRDLRRLRIVQFRGQPALRRAGRRLHQPDSGVHAAVWGESAARGLSSFAISGFGPGHRWGAAQSVAGDSGRARKRSEVAYGCGQQRFGTRPEKQVNSGLIRCTDEASKCSSGGQSNKPLSPFARLTSSATTRLGRMAGAL